MTQEEKATAFDRALERAKYWVENPTVWSSDDICQKLFPELAESEDERIRKDIIHLVQKSHEQGGYALHKYEADEMLAWLEKQSQTFTKKDVDDAYIKGVFDAKKEFEKQDLQLLDNSAKTCKDEKKTTWSEEDEHWRQKAIDFMKHPDLIKATPTLAKDTTAWLKSIKSRVQPQQKDWSEEDERIYKSITYSFAHNYPLTVQQQEFVKFLKDKVWPKQEWSDVDKDILFRIIDDLKFLRDDISKDTKYAVNIVDVEREINWLESIKYRYTWKPSDGQLNNILDVLSFDNCTPKRRELLESLYNDLKKLKD